MSVINSPVSAISVLIQAVELGQQNGVYDLAEARLIADAIDYLMGTSESSEIEENNNAENVVSEIPNNVYREELNRASIPYEDEVKPVNKFVDNTIPAVKSNADKAIVR